ncbi:MAG: nucleoside deaminase [Candidatus Gastranaerophilales bacterium]|nr:nucleoside deaminase [Candidatus Gastranaerophilales bacterium]
MLNKFMHLAIDEAKKVKKDIPICALIVKNGKIIALETNKREQENKTIAHAEILAISEANKKLNSWRLDDCDMFVTLEPCPMCAWAIINARIKNLYFGSYDLRYGACTSALNLANLANSKINIKGGILEQECNDLLKKYFENLRNEK